MFFFAVLLNFLTKNASERDRFWLATADDATQFPANAWLELSSACLH